LKPKPNADSPITSSEVWSATVISTYHDVKRVK
jgi:hypothetical protein